MAARVFWESKTLAEMSASEWESLCDGCGKCCLHKLEDEETDEVYYTQVACKLLDTEQCRCTDYPNRQARVPDCLTLTASQIDEFHWLPATCSYRLLAESKPLPNWHPLKTGDPGSVHSAGMSVAGKVVREVDIDPEELEEYIIHWVE